MVLIDTESSHNIIQPRLAKHLHLSTQPTSLFKVMVGNGAHILCQDYCPQVAISFQQHTFQVPLYLLPIEGADVVLGLAWLRTLGPVQADFSIPSFTFNHHFMPITITGETLHNPTQASFHQHQDSIASFHLLTICSVTTPPTISTNIHPSTTDPPPIFQQALSTLLQKFSQIFQQPHSLPPSRPHDHHIPLIPSSNPVNIKPYCYPHSQKDTMTSIISSMLHDGIIKPSTSPFSSPVLLVKKKDGTWRFCVDYRALNAITIRDRFPIPTIDELLDELGAARVFSKIDLRSCYHQIRVAPSDTYKTAFRTFDGHYEFLDILVYSESFDSHLSHLRIILNLLPSNQFYAKLSKCEFGVTSVEYLGHIINDQGVSPDATKIQAIVEWPAPRSLSTLCGFLGLSSTFREELRYYRRSSHQFT
uniref:Transposon Ty3-I Gag-Pol polyprotein n=1 Tax=Cajanus cajan TaxID=3821 RepID=A0A151SBD6_CAJCA|nr:Transposon Ty3-I Gag-Pol polyprotein [Cajanus cajan]